MQPARFAAIAVLVWWALGSRAFAIDNTNDFLSIDTSSNAVYRVAVVTNGITALTDSNNLPKLWFPVGEEMTYNIYWGYINIGSSHISSDWVTQNGQPRLRIRHVTKTNRIVATVYPVEDTLETVIDPVTFLPVYFRKTLSEGHYHADEINAFHHADGTMDQGSYRNGHVKKFAIDHDTRDLVTMMYWLRKTPFQPGSTNTYRVMADEKVYDLTTRVRSEETQKIGDYGKVNVLRIDPEAAFNGLFIRSGKIVFWVSHDQRQLCTQVEAEVPVANIHLKLDTVTGPGTDSWVTGGEPEPPGHSRNEPMSR